MTEPKTFTDPERERFRKLLEVANSTTYEGEKEAALAAATRLAKSKGMSLHEAAGMEDPKEKQERIREAREAARRKRRSESEFGKTMRAASGGYRYEKERSAAEKKRYDEAMAEAVRRGLKLDEDERPKSRPPQKRKASSGAWRSRPDFIRVLLRDTKMSAQEIAATVGVSVHEVFKEKLLMRRAS